MARRNAPDRGVEPVCASIAACPIAMAHLNRYPAALSGADGALREPDLEHIDLPLCLMLVEPGSTIPHAVFIETGLCSVVSNPRDGSRIEVDCSARTAWRSRR
ncbi:hypothetical protein [Methylobacterium mesophilicum]|uniref:hypothetical protein n=1 Tax=Methylobacterium mesophilicum TaxID=39956 RepID=UPI001FCE8C57|nr:hypothetical protein [Methylobacterium mesophilicum]